MEPLRILIAHNRYQEGGGEDRVVFEERRMLERQGHPVAFFSADNDSINTPVERVRAAVGSFYSQESAREFLKKVDDFKPDIVHVHNFFPTLSPSIHFAAKRHNIPLIQTLHNYRLLCANAEFFREGKPCEECLASRSFLPGVLHACYRGSRLGSAIVGAGNAVHHLLGTWSTRVDRFISTSKFAAHKLSSYRIPADRIRVKPNFVEDGPVGTGDGGFALFAGRLSPEKGLRTLIDADLLGSLELPVYIVGDGPMLPVMQAAASRSRSRLRVLGALPHPELQELMRKANVLVVPSLWYEPFGMVVAEAFAVGLPVAASRIGGLSELVEDGVCGYTFRPGDAAALSESLNAFAKKTSTVASLREKARQEYETKYSEARNYQLLLAIYREALTVRSGAVA